MKIDRLKATYRCSWETPIYFSICCGGPTSGGRH